MEKPAEGGGKKVIIRLSIDQIHPDPQQPRKKFNKQSLHGLAQSINSGGLKQPIIITFWKNVDGIDHYIIKYGERRWRACKIAHVTEIDCVLEEGDYDGVKYSAKRELSQAAENFCREPQTHSEIIGVVERVVEEEVLARAGNRGSVGVAITNIAHSFGKSEAWVWNYHRLTMLHHELRDLLDEEDDDRRLSVVLALKLCIAPKAVQIKILEDSKVHKEKGGYVAMQRYVVMEVRKILDEQGVKVRGKKPHDDKRDFERMINGLSRVSNNFCGERHSTEHLLYLQQLVNSLSPIQVDMLLSSIKTSLVAFTQVRDVLQTRRDAHYKKIFKD